MPSEDMISVAKLVGGFSKLSNVGIGEFGESKKPNDAKNRPKTRVEIGIMIPPQNKKIQNFIFCWNVICWRYFFNLIFINF